MASVLLSVAQFGLVCFFAYGWFAVSVLDDDPTWGLIIAAPGAAIAVLAALRLRGRIGAMSSAYWTIASLSGVLLAIYLVDGLAGVAAPTSLLAVCTALLVAAGWTAQSSDQAISRYAIGGLAPLALLAAMWVAHATEAARIGDDEWAWSLESLLDALAIWTTRFVATDAAMPVAAMLVSGLCIAGLALPTARRARHVGAAAVLALAIGIGIDAADAPSQFEVDAEFGEMTFAEEVPWSDEPNGAMVADPNAVQAIDPVTGAPIDPATGDNIDPTAGPYAGP